MFFNLMLPLISAISICNFVEKVKTLYYSHNLFLSAIDVFQVDLSLASVKPSATDTGGK